MSRPRNLRNVVTVAVAKIYKVDRRIHTLDGASGRQVRVP